jgi:hypothetical protein
MAGEKKRAKAPRSHAIWTDAEDRALEWDWGTVKASTMATKMGRSPWALASRAKFLGLSFRNQGVFSLKDVAKKLGYTSETIKKFADVAGIQLMRNPRTHWRRGQRQKYRHFRITEDQIEAMTRYLDRVGWPEKVPVKGQLPVRPQACLSCGRDITGRTPSGRPVHAGRGLCTVCHARKTRSGEIKRFPRLRKKRA